MLESINAAVPAPKWRWTLNSEYQSAKDGWTNTGVVFYEGKGTFNGSSYLTSKLSIPLGVYSVRIKCNVTNFAAYRHLIDFRGTSINGVGRVYTNITNGVVTPTSGTVYVNGVQTTSITANTNLDIIISGITIKSGTGTNYNLIGANPIFTDVMLGSIDLIEIYQGTLSASEVANLYNNTRNRSLSPTTTKYPVMHVTANRGIVESRFATLSAVTAVSVVQDGSFKVMDFNGSTSEITLANTTNYGTDRTYLTWLKLRSLGESNLGAVFHGAPSYLLCTTPNRFTLRGDNYSANNSIELWKWFHLAITKKADGKTSYYINSVLSGAADQAGGLTSTGVGTNTYIGYRGDNDTLHLDGRMGDIQIWRGILTPAELSQIYTSEKKSFI